MPLGDHDPRWKNPQGSTNEQLYLWAQDLIKELRRGDYISSAIGSGIANDQLADMAAWTIKMRNNAAAGDPQDVTINGLTEETVIAPTSDFLMLWDTSAGAMRKAKPQYMGGLVFLTSGTINNAATLDIVLTSYTAYATILIVLAELVPQTDDSQLQARFSTNGGSSYDSAANSYSFATDGMSSIATSVSDGSSGAATFIGISTSNVNNKLSSDAGAQGAFVITLHGRTNGSLKTLATWRGGYINTGGASIAINGTGNRTVAQDTDAIRFLMSSGNIASGTYAVYGIA
jgi:phage baseplate assembly protein gpV